ncbi:HD-like signal output (HDOD) protein [Pseudoduganella lurida]|uniref:histidine kinase n=1 Tax=Pseudoduganella lurida TaxID=1036180 RepID=A0A562QXQ6_9BURK|nr:HDOD domain-containing protein [Pseudoduganella lurida]TWI61565.1 HD-like signal output (HDOD) protein [Pseudoduganella lurida]
MPQILVKLIELLQADDAGMPELAALIAKDAGMTGKILTVANSSAYHRPQRTAGLEQALVALGTDMIKTLVISESVFQTFNNFPHAGSTDLRAFWKQSLGTAVVARDLARLMDYPHVEEAYLAGLLHNVGRLALLATAPRDYATNFMARDDDDLCAVEQRTLQITHTEAGAWLIERWHLDSFLADSVLYHHEPVARLEGAHPLIRVVRLAHLLVYHPDQEESILAGVALCGVTRVEADAVLKSAARQVQRSAEHLGIDLAGADDIVQPPATMPPTIDAVQARLQEEMRNLMLVAEVGQTFARQQDEAALLAVVTRSARILFDFGTTVALLEDPNGTALVGVPSGAQQHRLAGFTIALDRRGFIADAAGSRKPAFVARGDLALSIAEEQLLRLLGGEAMVCLPLVAGQRCGGVLVAGVAAWQLPMLDKRERFLQAFAGQAATALATVFAERGQAQRRIAHVTQEYREASRRVVHEVNNPLSIIKNYLSVLDDKLARREPVVSEMSILNEEIDRVGHLINGLADLQPSDPGPGGAQSANLARVVDDVLRLFRATGFIPASIQVLVRMQEQPNDIDGDADLLKQILVNLVKNSIEAMPDGGRIEIANRGHVNRDRKLFVELVVSDNGPGLAPAVLANLFAEVKSAKEGKHHGLGLSIVHGLVQQLNGLITCRSGKDGTSFEILLPARGSNSQLAVPAARVMEA